MQKKSDKELEKELEEFIKYAASYRHINSLTYAPQASINNISGELTRYDQGYAFLELNPHSDKDDEFYRRMALQVNNPLMYKKVDDENSERPINILCNAIACTYNKYGPDSDSGFPSRRKFIKNMLNYLEKSDNTISAEDKIEALHIISSTLDAIMTNDNVSNNKSYVKELQQFKSRAISISSKAEVSKISKHIIDQLNTLNDCDTSTNQQTKNQLTKELRLFIGKMHHKDKINGTNYLDQAAGDIKRSVELNDNGKSDAAKMLGEEQVKESHAQYLRNQQESNMIKDATMHDTKSTSYSTSCEDLDEFIKYSMSKMSGLLQRLKHYGYEGNIKNTMLLQDIKDEIKHYSSQYSQVHLQKMHMKGPSDLFYIKMCSQISNPLMYKKVDGENSERPIKILCDALINTYKTGHEPDSASGFPSRRKFIKNMLNYLEKSDNTISAEDKIEALHIISSTLDAITKLKVVTSNVKYTEELKSFQKRTNMLIDKCPEQAQNYEKKQSCKKQIKDILVQNHNDWVKEKELFLLSRQYYYNDLFITAVQEVMLDPTYSDRYGNLLDKFTKTQYRNDQELLQQSQFYDLAKQKIQFEPFKTTLAQYAQSIVELAQEITKNAGNLEALQQSILTKLASPKASQTTQQHILFTAVQILNQNTQQQCAQTLGMVAFNEQYILDWLNKQQSFAALKANTRTVDKTSEFPGSFIKSSKAQSYNVISGITSNSPNIKNIDYKFEF